MLPKLEKENGIMEIITINGQKRTETGKKSSRSIRREGMIPAVLYGGDEVVHFTVNPNSVRGLVYTPNFKLAEIEVDGTKHKAILKDYQMHPVTDEITHIDFLRLVDGVPIKVDVPIRFKGVAPGVKSGGKLQRNVRRVRIKTTPDYLVDELLVDVSGLEMGQSIRVRDIDPNENIEIMTNPSVPVGQVVVPRAMRSAATAAAKAAGLEGPIAEEGEGEEGEETPAED